MPPRSRADRRQNVPAMGTPGYYPDHAAERRAELATSTPAQRLADAIRISRVATRLAAAGRDR